MKAGFDINRRIFCLKILINQCFAFYWDSENIAELRARARKWFPFTAAFHLDHVISTSD